MDKGILTYEEALSYIRTSATPGSVYGLERIRALLGELGNPQEGLWFIHVAGTNGKGSVSRMLMSILQAAGYRVGSFNSPSLCGPYEYLNINGQDATREVFAERTLRIREAVERLEPQLRPTAFEIYTAMAIDYFASEHCNPVILECGMGGLTDSTNVIPAPVLAIITRIGLDHVPELGRNIAEIAQQKAGIIKKGCTVVCYPSENEALEAVRTHVANTYAREFADGTDDISNRLRIVKPQELTITENSVFSGCVISYGKYTDLRLGLKGNFQGLNAATVLEAVDVLRANGYSISLPAVKEGLVQASWPARFEIISDDPLVVIDGGHNPQCMDALCESLKILRREKNIPDGKKFILVTGVMSDKSYDTIFERLSEFAGFVIATEPDNSRRLGAESIQKVFEGFGVNGMTINKPSEAVKKALELMDSCENGSKYCGVLVTGSLYMMGEVRESLVADTRK